MKVAVIQQANTADYAHNLATSEAQLRAAAANGARLALLQELHTGLYFCQTEDPATFDQAEPIPGPSSHWLGALAHELDMVIVGSLFERRTAGLYHNTAVVLDTDGSLAGCYRKMHIPDDPGFYEKFYFTPGDARHDQNNCGFTPIDTSLGRLGVLVCWDQWYPEAARLMALAGADLLLYPTAIGWDKHDTPEEQQRQLDAWMTIQRAHAVANGLPLLSANRCGFEAAPSGAVYAATSSLTEHSGIDFWGNSFICGPQGELLAHADNNSPQLLMADLDLQRCEEVRRIWPFLRDRRIDAYGDLMRRFIDSDPARSKP